MSNKSRQPELDYLRGIACLMVVFFHYLSRGPRAGWTGGALFPLTESVAQYGHYGVHLFFMISGYVIYKSATGRTVGAFAKARFWRLYPAYWAGILITTIFVISFNAMTFQVSVRDFFWNLTMFQQWVNAQSVDGAYWSLMVEMVFYIYIGLAIKFKVIDRTYLLLSLVLLISAINLRLDSYWVDALLLAKWAPYFAIGIVGYKIREKDRFWVAITIFCMALLIACLRIYLDSKVRSNGNYWIEISIVIALSLLFIVIVGRASNRAPTPVSNFFGDLTYPVYLVHQNIGYVLLATFAMRLGSAMALVCALIIVIGLGSLMNQLIEKRFTTFVRRRFAI